MVKKIGNLSLCLISILINFYVICSDNSKIDLAALTMDSYAIDSIAVGLPFGIQVSIESQDEILQKPQVEGIENFQILQIIPSFGQTIISGKTKYENRYLYVVKASNPGKFKVGPARVILKNGKEIKSEIVNINVDAAKKKSADFDDTVKYRLIIKRKDFYIGEKVPFVLSLSFDNSKSIKLHAIQDPETAGIKGLKMAGPTSKQELIDDTTFQTLQWKGEFYPASAGTLSLGPLKAGYRIGFRLYEALSEPVKINIKELPKYDKEINTIGSKFKDFSISLQKQKISTDEAVLLRLSLKGEGDLENLQAPKLDLPEFLRSYSGSKKIDGNTISFEYVVQAEQPGIYNIPKQKFIYFDIDKKKYITLSSNELELVVEQGAKQKPADIEKKAVELKSQEIKPEVKKFAEIPDILFILLLLIPIILILINNISLSLSESKLFKKIKYKIELMHAIRSLNAAQRKADAISIYPILRNIIIKKFDLPSDVTDKDIDNTLISHGFNREKLNEWNEFVNQLNSQIFYINSKKTDIEYLFKQSYYWLNILKRMKI